ncbi:MAG: DNA primase catalytic subunit PriS [Candidatus Hodarchaeales archaeon]
MSDFITALDLLQGGRRVISRYYEQEFDPTHLLTVIGTENFSHREFAFVDHRGYFHRNLSFVNVDDMVDFLVTRAPEDFFVGAVYALPPSKDFLVTRDNWLYRELVFDLDLDLYDPVRRCGCRGAGQFCIHCWELIVTAATFIHDSLIIDFGIDERDIHWFFSGRRGLHAWINDPEFTQLDSTTRSAIVSYLSMINDDVVDPLPWSPLFRQRIHDLVIDSFIIDAGQVELLECGLRPVEVKKILQLRHSPSTTIERLLELTFPKGLYLTNERVKNNILKLRSPRFDRKVTTDITRLLRVPGTIHSRTNKISKSVRFDKLSSFDPLKNAGRLQVM